MAKSNKRITLPPFDLQSTTTTTTALFGYSPSSPVRGGLSYEPRAIPLAVGGDVVTTGITAADISYVLTGGGRTVAFSHSGGAKPHEYDSAGDAWREITGLPTGPLVGVVFRDTIYFIAENHRIYVLNDPVEPVDPEGVVSFSASLTDANLHSQVPAGEPAPTFAVEWQGRVWVAVGNRVFWSNVLNFLEWRQHRVVQDAAGNDQDVSTTAGRQRFDGAVTGMERLDSGLYVFLADGSISRTEVLDANIQFGFIPSTTAIPFIGGAVTTHQGIYFLGRNAIYRVIGDTVERVSWPLADSLHQFAPLEGRAPRITHAVDNGTIFWHAEGVHPLIALDVNRGFSYLVEPPMQGRQIDALATFNRVSNAINSVQEGIDRTHFIIDDLSDSSDLTPLSLTDADDGEMRITRFEIPEEAIIRMRLSRQGQYRRTYVDHVSVPELNQYEIRWKSADKLAWRGPRQPNNFGVVNIHEPLNGVDMEIRTREPIRVSEMEIRSGEISR